MRITLQDIADSRIPEHIGLCAADIPRIASYINEAQERLIYAGGEDGWWGSWAKVVFNVNRDDPYITLPNEFARMIAMDVCRTPVKIQNEWYEFLQAGIGLQSECNNCMPIQTYERGTVPTAYDLTATNQYIRVYITDARDIGKRIAFLQAKDANGNGIYTQDTTNPVIGFILTMTQPFVTTAYVVSSFVAIDKDETYGDVIVKQVDATSGTEVLLARLGPKVFIPQYRRYYIHGLPRNCCRDDQTTVQITTMLKYEFAKVSRPTDLLIIGNKAALKEECAAIRYGEIDSLESKAKSEAAHLKAIRLLNQELTHYLGTQLPAINVAPFGTAHLRRRAIGTLT
jgi:hypothetical protein